MDAEVWQHIPEEIIPLILARLPWWSNLQLRGVCKSWHAKLSDPAFFSSCRSSTTSGSLPTSSSSSSSSSSSQQQHSLYGILSPGILSTAEICAVVNILGKHYWNALPRPSSLPNFGASDFFELHAATKGLLLMEGKLMEKGRVLINPMNKTHRRVPPVPSLTSLTSLTSPTTTETTMSSEGLLAARGMIKEHIQGMTVDVRTHDVRVIALQHHSIDGHVVPSSARNQAYVSDLELWRIYVYDLRRDEWELVSSMQSEHLQRIKGAILVNEILYILTKQPSSRHRHRHRVFKAVGTDLVEVPAEITIDFPIVHLFEHRGSLMLVGGKKNTPIGIWRLDEVLEQWQKVASMPDNLVASGWGRRDFTIDAEGDFVCMSTYAKKDVILIVNLVEGRWESVNCKNDFLYQDWACIRTFLWEPRLDILV